MPGRTRTSLLAALLATTLLHPGATLAQPAPPSPDALLTQLRQHVKYVFVLYQENRSFDSYFGTYPGAEGLFSRPPEETPGFSQVLIGTDGTESQIQPFRIGPQQFAADTDDIDHSHALIVAKMNVQDGHPRMDRFAVTEERKYSPTGNPSLMAKQFGELAMAYEDCDTVPFLWDYAKKFALFDHIFQTMTGPSTPGNLAIIAAQSGLTQWALHPNEAAPGNGNSGAGEPVSDDDDPIAGSPKDHSAHPLPVNPADFRGAHPYGVQLNQTYASLPLTMGGRDTPAIAKHDTDPAADLADVSHDVPAIAQRGTAQIDWRWYEEGFDREPTDPAAADPTDATGQHASYITHHNGPQYFGYIANNPEMVQHLRGLNDLFTDLSKNALPDGGGLFYVKGGYHNIMGLLPADPDPVVQKNFLGDDDHPAYSDSQISEALIAKTVNAIARSKYWPESAIIITWDDSEGDYDHVPPTIRHTGPDGSVTGDGPRVPLILISPYAYTGAIVQTQGSHASVVKFADRLFDLPPLATLPDELEGRKQGELHFHQSGLGPDDALSPDIDDLTDAFDPARLAGRTAPLPGSYAEIPDATVAKLPQATGYGCQAIGITPVDVAGNLPNHIPADFNPRPKTNPTAPTAAPPAAPATTQAPAPIHR